jgi:hypothetical protein
MSLLDLTSFIKIVRRLWEPETQERHGNSEENHVSVMQVSPVLGDVVEIDHWEHNIL